MDQTGIWTPIGLDSSLERGSAALPTVPHRGSIEQLPLELLSWPDFESLQWRILRDVEGLRHAQIYGTPGQRQLGLDIIAVAPDETGVALQSKRVEQFGPADIVAAVDAFRMTTRPFDVSRFIIGVSREVRTTATIDRFMALRQELKPIDLVLWDKRELSVKLKGAPHIVIEYFGKDIAEQFCTPFVIGTTVVPSHDAVAIREAVARTPEEVTGAGPLIEQAKQLTHEDPHRALGLVESAQAALAAAGFAGHASQHESLRASLLVALNRGTEATRRRLDELWNSLDQGLVNHADIARSDISALTSQIGTPSAHEHLSVADCALSLYINPLATVPNFHALVTGTTADRARLAALAGETALAADNQTWLTGNAEHLASLAEELDGEAKDMTLNVRLRILAAEGSGEWASVLGDAQTLRLGYALGALVTARHARHLALQQRFRLADAAWDEAAGSACLAQRWTDAARWIFSRRVFRTRWNLFRSDELLPLQTALASRGPDKTVLPRDEDALEYAFGRLAEDKPRPAAIAAQRALRDAVTLSDWEGERRARRLLADILQVSDEPELAAQHLVRAGEVKALQQLGTNQANRYLDVTSHLYTTPYWIAGAAYRLIATQADLVPDHSIESIADRILDEFAAVADGSLIDMVGTTGSRYLGAIASLAGIAARLTNPQADRALTHFEAQPPVEPGHYRYHDEDEASAVAAILTTQPTLVDRALTHLVALLARSDGSRKTRTIDAVVDRIEAARPLLAAFAASGNSWAQELLASEEPAQVEPELAQRALIRLKTPLEHTPGVIKHGGGARAVSDSLIVRRLPPADLQAVLTQLIDRADDRQVASADRSSYMLAAANLAPEVDTTTRSSYFEPALKLITAPSASLADVAENRFAHRLGMMRITPSKDSRGQAAFLAAALAQTSRQKERVRDAALTLIGDESVSEYWVTRALQRLGDTLAPDVGFLSGQGWELRSLAAILWSKTTEPAPVGFRLASDPDVRVRRTLATALADADRDEATSTSPERAEKEAQPQAREEIRRTVLTLLEQDPRYTVRSAANYSARMTG